MNLDVRTVESTRLSAGARSALGNLSLVDDIRIYSPDRTDPDIAFVNAYGNALAGRVEQSVGTVTGTGKGFDVDHALTASVGEVVERYCAYCSTAEFERTTHRELSEREPVADFEHLSLYTDEQVAETEFLTEFTRDTPVRWRRGTNLLTGEEVFVPAEVVHTFDRSELDGGFHVYGTTSGCACGRTREEALVGSVMEQFERDAFMRTWLTGTAPDRVSLDAFPEVRRLRDERVQRPPYDYEFVAFDSPAGVHVYGCLATADGETLPHFVLGIGVGLTEQAALEDALLEAAQVEIATRLRLASRDEPPEGPDCYNFTDNVDYYARPENFSAVERLFEGERRAPSPSPEPDRPYEECLRRCREAGLTPVAFDLTTPDAAQLGWRVTRVYVPELLDFSVPGLPPLAHPRLSGVETVAEPHPFG